MITVLCSAPHWSDGHISECVQDNYVAFLVPVTTVSVSILLVLGRILWRTYSGGSTPYSFTRLATEDSDDVVVDNNGTAEHPADRPPASTCYVREHNFRIAILEPLAFLADLGFRALYFVPEDAAVNRGPNTVAQSLSDAYLLSLALYRLFRSRTWPSICKELWTHSVALSILFWLTYFWNFHAAIVETPFTIDSYLLLGHFLVLTSVMLLVLTAPPTEHGHGVPRDADTTSGPSKESSASLLSLFAFCWVTPLVWKGYRSPLESHDLGHLSADQKASHLGLVFLHSDLPTYGMTRRLLRVHWQDLLKQGLWAAGMSIAIFVPTILMKTILTYLEDPSSLRASTAWLCVALLFISGIAASAAECQTEWIGRKISAKSRSILIGEIYSKILQRKIGADRYTQDQSQDTSAGHSPDIPSNLSEGAIFNLMAVDSELISEVSAHLHLLWVTTPLQFFIGTAMLYGILGPSGLAGLALMILLLPLNTFLASKQGHVQGQLLLATDSRTELTNETLKNIRLVKLNAWVELFRHRILQSRNLELTRLRLKFIWWSLAMTLWYSAPLLIAFTTLFFYTAVAKNELIVSVAFPALTVFGILRLPLDRAAGIISYALQARVSLSRVEGFLEEEGIGEHTVPSHAVDQEGFVDATLTWPHSGSKIASEASQVDEIGLTDFTAASPFRLADINISIYRGELNIVYGSTGSGKSAFLLAILGEMRLLSGKAFFPSVVDVDGSQEFGNGNSIAYCSQEPWLMNKSMRENIIFGSPFDSERYATVLDACALGHDIKNLNHGDLALAGDRGSRLSGGQKQRVALARALYSNSDLVVLDDCLSALDPVTARHVFFKGIKGAIMRGRTCVMATHSVGLTIFHCDHAIRLERGRIIDQGTGRHLIAGGLIAADDVDKYEAETDDTAHHLVNIPFNATRDGLERTRYDRNQSAEDRQDEAIDHDSLASEGFTDDKAFESGNKESKFTGSIGWSVSKSYLQAMGSGFFWILALGTFALQQIASLSTNVWIKRWAQQYGSKHDDQNSTPRDASEQSNTVDPTFYLTIYGALCAAFIVVSFLRDFVVFWGALKGSERIHKRLLTSVLGARLSFFDSVSQGQVLNRFSKDVQTVDQSIATRSTSTLHLLAGIVTILVLISVMVPLFLPGAVLICGFYYILMMVFISSSRDLRRIESIERSPLYQHFGETNTGYLTIRAFRRCSMFTARLHDLVDRFTCPHIMLWASKEWLSFNVGLASSSISCLTGAFSLWFLGSGRAGAAGLIMSYAATFTESIFLFVQLYAMVQQDLSSVERIVEYTSLEQEPSTPSPNYDNDLSNWPSEGFVRFVNYTTRYAPELEPALGNITIEARSGQRVAIVGRTGAGKSTLTMALVRALEAVEGSITIDGVNIATIDLQKLRRAITVVPQDPTLFSGTLQDNLDPTNSHSVEEILSALRHVQIFPTDDTRSTTDLSQPVFKLSLGQRQLVCTARALLRGARILVLDEATASMDHNTDARIQAGLRASAAAGNTTVITIAHRLRTIADYDYVYVLDGGRIAEEGTVKDLLQKRGEDAVFRGLCVETGELDLIGRVAAGI